MPETSDCSALHFLGGALESSSHRHLDPNHHPTPVETSVRNAIGRFVAGKLLPRAAYPVVRGPLKGARFVLGSAAGEGGGASIYLNLSEPETANALASELRRGDLFFDVGANIGYFTTLASRLVGPDGMVIAFEPLLRNIS